jgi:DinB family protein
LLVIVEHLAKLLDFLAETPTKLASLTSKLSNEELRWKHSADEFSVLESICHLRDLELLGYTPRITRIISEDGSVLPDFDGARVAAESNYNAEALDLALQAFESARTANVHKLKALEEAQWKREGTLEGVGLVTLEKLAALMREHDEGHLEDLRVLQQQLDRERPSEPTRA